MCSDDIIVVRATKQQDGLFGEDGAASQQLEDQQQQDNLAADELLQAEREQHYQTFLQVPLFPRP